MFQILLLFVLDMALDKSEKELGLRYEKVIRLYPIFCNAVLSTGYLSDLIHNYQIDALIGPGCSGEVV